jgi:hypothetical protein
MLSLTVEAKAREPFGDDVLERWLVAGDSERSKVNRKARWDYIQLHLPKHDSLLLVRYQMLHE